jgi:hypothetical protein
MGLAMDVWLHVGAPKTGTSALQAALARARGRLAEAGLCYPVACDADADARACRGEITTGNGAAIGCLVAPAHRPPGFDPAVACAWLERALAEAGDGRTVLFSSEVMQRPEPEAARALLDLLTQGGRRRLRILYFVRHALDYAVADYAQLLKVGMVPQHAADLDDERLQPAFLLARPLNLVEDRREPRRARHHKDRQIAHRAKFAPVMLDQRQLRTGALHAIQHRRLTDPREQPAHDMHGIRRPLLAPRRVV